MLILTRNTTERVCIGNDIVLHVLEVRGGRIKLGFDAPQDVRIIRKELIEGRDERNDRRRKQD